MGKRYGTTPAELIGLDLKDLGSYEVNYYVFSMAKIKDYCDMQDRVRKNGGEAKEGCKVTVVKTKEELEKLNQRKRAEFLKNARERRNKLEGSKK